MTTMLVHIKSSSTLKIVLFGHISRFSWLFEFAKVQLVRSPYQKVRPRSAYLPITQDTSSAEVNIDISCENTQRLIYRTLNIYIADPRRELVSSEY